MDGVKKRRREKSQKGFLLALEWLKGNLDLSSVGGGGLDEVVGEQRKKRKNSKRGKIVKNSEGKKGVVRWREEARGRKLDGRGQRSSREDRQRRTPVRTKFSCTRCGALSATLYLFKKHVASCRVEPEWTGTERVFCSGCKVDRDDGREMLECDNCHVWEHTSCNGITDPTMEWFCEACRVAASESAKVVANGKVFETVHEDLSLCEKCLQGDDPANLFLCDSCNRGYHTYCMLPGMALPSATDEEWFCSPRCRQNINEFEKKLRQEIKVENEQLRRQQSQVDMAQGFAESDKNPLVIELLDTATDRMLHSGAQKMLIAAFGSLSGGGGMDVRYIISSLRSQKEGPWDNSLHRTLILQQGGEVLSVCTFRLLGDNAAAELIFAVTASTAQKSGLFRKLHDMLVRALCRHAVQHLVIHATKSSEKHFLNYGRPPQRGSHRQLNRPHQLLSSYKSLQRDRSEYHRLLPRLLEMDSIMLITSLKQQS